MKKEFEVISHNTLNHIEILLVEVNRRNLHGHNDLEIGIVLEGSIYVTIDGVAYLLKKNDVYLFNHYQIHSFSKTEESNLILALQISSNLYKNYFYSLQHTEFEDNLIKNDTQLSSIKKLLIEIAYYYFTKPDYFEFKCMSRLNDLLFYLMNSIPHHTIPEKEQNVIRQNTHRLNSIIEFIEENYAMKISLRDIANREHLSIHYISHFIKNIMGISFQDYLNNVRFQHAYQLMLHSDLTITDICMETGISNSRYLNNMFYRHFGYGIREYKKNMPTQVKSTQITSSDNVETRLNNFLSQKIISKYFIK